MSSGVEASSSAGNIKTPVVADPYSLEWWNSAWHVPWGYQQEYLTSGSTHDMGRDSSSLDLKRELHPDSQMVPTISRYPDHVSEARSPSLISSSHSLSPVPTLDSEFSSIHAGSPPSIHQATEGTPEDTLLHRLSPQLETKPKQEPEYSEPVLLTYQTPTNNTVPPSTPSRDTANGQNLMKEAQESAKARRKIAHNAVERRYRVNMNAKFIALGKAIPSLRAGKPNASLRSKGIKVNLNDSTVIQNKAEVLTKALAYIQELQEERCLLQNEVSALRGHLLSRGIW
ncbi:HLH DNA binding domain protein, putative [Paecilomyces variotii No. 5]|uniref:HLH DNA binding domain protein, putative n=1 Tax=Byssochlamys spectabilis (strain No. 5 / NBRC 109023) TaxID=1356009 RepID=V5HVZ3_BYSSN|nr:HLH DNA binding domain protein, putative [Paecilomyces variotii No. 5]